MLAAGPCAIESRKQAFKIARYVQKQGATHFRGGLYKGQNRPYVNGKPEYKGLGSDGLYILTDIQDTLGISCICDAQAPSQVDDILQAGIDYLMVGTRNMDNLALLRYINNTFNEYKLDKKIILKRAPAATVKEWIGAAEHLGGPERVILCERGIVSFDRHDYTRYRLDLIGIAEVKTYEPAYKIIADPSHGSGNRDLVHLLSRCLLEITDGLMIEVHDNPNSSPTDAPQIVDFRQFKKIAELYNEKGKC
jgi:3-deoxy-7-phosphoheptulonate synthase